MSKHAHVQFESGVLAVVHRAGGVLRVLVASTRNGQPVIEEAREIPAARLPGEEDPLEAILARHRVERVIGVLPASSVVCRTCTLPDADRDQIDQALRLQAEAHLLAGSNEYRTAMSVLPSAPGETARSGIIVSWPEAAVIDPLPGAGAAGRPVTWAPDVAGLAALLGPHRPIGPLLWIDRPSGSVALAITHANGAVLRCTREEAASADDWKQRVTRALAETALSVGHTGAFAESIVRSNEQALRTVGSGGAALIIDNELIAAASARIEGTRPDQDWWSSFGIAVGVLLAATSDLAPLTMLKEAPEVERPSRFHSVAATLSRPRNAVKAIIACLIIFALTPPAVSRLRLAVLDLRHPDIEGQTEMVDETQERLAMYRALEEQAFSITKMLADVVSNTPRGIQLKSIRIQLNDRTFAVNGEAVPHGERSAPEIVAQMQDHLRDSRLFSDIKLNWSDPNAYKTYKFELSAKIAKPHWRSPYPVELDYAKWPLVRREANQGPLEEELADADADADADVDLVADAGTNDSDAATERPAEPRGERPVEAVASAAPSGEPRVTPPVVPAGAGARAGGAETVDPEAAGAEQNVTDGGRTRIRGGGPGSGPADGLGGRGSKEARQDASKIDRGAIPAPVTEEQIAAMTPQEVSKQLTAVAKAKNNLKNRDNDPELWDRLKNEFDLLMKRMREKR